MSRTYLLALNVCRPIVGLWGRLEVDGLESLPPAGPVIVASNHDSYWDPVAVGIAAIGRRQIRALSKSTLWNVKGLDRVLDGMGQIPVVRGTSDRDALDRAISELRSGACVGIFPEGTRSLGRSLRARSGIGRLASAVPEARIVCAAIEGTTDIPRFPRRPRVRVSFFEPGAGQMRPGEGAGDLAVRIVDELRARSPVSAAGRRARRQIAAESDHEARTTH